MLTRLNLPLMRRRTVKPLLLYSESHYTFFFFMLNETWCPMTAQHKLEEGDTRLTAPPGLLETAPSGIQRVGSVSRRWLTRLTIVFHPLCFPAWYWGPLSAFRRHLGRNFSKMEPTAPSATTQEILPKKHQKPDFFLQSVSNEALRIPVTQERLRVGRYTCQFNDNRLSRNQAEVWSDGQHCFFRQVRRIFFV